MIHITESLHFFGTAFFLSMTLNRLEIYEKRKFNLEHLAIAKQKT